MLDELGWLRGGLDELGDQRRVEQMNMQGWMRQDGLEED